jgi:hypothetical protein
VTEPWTLRASVPDDEGCIVSMWIGSLWYFDRARYLQEHPETNRDEISRLPSTAFWNKHQPIVTALARYGQTTVACDPERVEYRPGEQSVIWGWACVSSGMIHGCCIKRSLKKAGYGGDMARALLGNRLRTSQKLSFPQPDLDSFHLRPRNWEQDHEWTGWLMDWAKAVGDKDATWRAAASFIADPKRVPWSPSPDAGEAA